jgi:hypothetical protein
MHQRPREWRQWYERASTADAALAYPEPWAARLSAFEKVLLAFLLSHASALDAAREYVMAKLPARVATAAFAESLSTADAISVPAMATKTPELKAKQHHTAINTDEEEPMWSLQTAAAHADSSTPVICLVGNVQDTHHSHNGDSSSQQELRSHHATVQSIIALQQSLGGGNRNTHVFASRLAAKAQSEMASVQTSTTSSSLPSFGVYDHSAVIAAVERATRAGDWVILADPHEASRSLLDTVWHLCGPVESSLSPDETAASMPTRSQHQSQYQTQTPKESSKQPQRHADFRLWIVVDESAALRFEPSPSVDAPFRRLSHASSLASIAALQPAMPALVPTAISGIFQSPLSIDARRLPEHASRAECDAEHCDIVVDVGDLGRNRHTEVSRDGDSEGAAIIQRLGDSSTDSTAIISGRVACTGEPLASLPRVWWECSLKVRVARASESQAVAGIAVTASVRCVAVLIHVLILFEYSGCFCQ